MYVMSRFTLGSSLLGLALVAGCKEKPSADLAPTASALGSAMPVAASAVPLTIEQSSSSVKFLMDSPLEKIDGDAPGSAQGELFVDLTDLTKSSGLFKVDLQKLTLYQQKRGDENEGYSERKKNDKQNEHARDWLQLVPHEGEVTAEQAEMNRWVEFKLDKFETSTANVAQMPGPERKVMANVSGDFRLHGRKARQSAKLELVFKYAGDKFESLSVKNVEPVPIKLEQYEVHPRDSAGKFVKTVTETIASNLKGKLKNEAPVEFAFVAKPK